MPVSDPLIRVESYIYKPHNATFSRGELYRSVELCQPPLELTIIRGITTTISISAYFFNWIAADKLTVRIDIFFPLAEAGAAHDYMEGRNTKGKVLLIP